MNNPPYPTPGKLYRLISKNELDGIIQLYSFGGLNNPYDEIFEFNPKKNFLVCLPCLTDEKRGRSFQMFLVSGAGKVVAFGTHPLRVGQEGSHLQYLEEVKVEEQEK